MFHVPCVPSDNCLRWLTAPVQTSLVQVNIELSMDQGKCKDPPFERDVTYHKKRKQFGCSFCVIVDFMCAKVCENNNTCKQMFSSASAKMIKNDQRTKQSEFNGNSLICKFCSVRAPWASNDPPRNLHLPCAVATRCLSREMLSG